MHINRERIPPVMIDIELFLKQRIPGGVCDIDRIPLGLCVELPPPLLDQQSAVFIVCIVRVLLSFRHADIIVGVRLGSDIPSFVRPMFPEP